MNFIVGDVNREVIFMIFHNNIECLLILIFQVIYFRKLGCNQKIIILFLVEKIGFTSEWFLQP